MVSELVSDSAVILLYLCNRVEKVEDRYSVQVDSEWKVKSSRLIKGKRKRSFGNKLQVQLTTSEQTKKIKC